MGLFSSWTEKDAEEFRQSELEKAVDRGLKEGFEKGHEEGLKQGHEEGLKQGHEEGLKQGHEQGLEQGRQKGQQLLAAVLHRLKDGETPDDIRNSGVDEETIQLALTCR